MVASRPPMSIWPSAPMLNRPARKPMATESPVRISGAAATRVSDQALTDPKAPWNRAT